MDGTAPAVTSGDAYEVEPTSWGRLVWMVGGRLSNSATLTVGKCYIAVGSANPRHYHPNCDEVLHVLQGEIEHSLNEETFRLSAGETISVPLGSMHNARNLGAQVAELLIVFSSADRQTIAESTIGVDDVA
jgi:quercetin dioxygenase-like cupin family protein